MPPALPIKKAYHFAIEHGLQAEVDKIRHLKMNPQVIAARKERTVRKGHLVSLLQDRGLWEQFVQNDWPTGKTPWGEQRTKHYLVWKSRNEDLDDEDTDDDQDGAVDDVEQGFVYESELRNYLKNNLHTIESGLKLYKDATRDGEEFRVENGRIDILAVDKQDCFVVIELKLSTGRNKAVGQLLYYMGWVDANLGKGKTPSRGMIIASEIPEDLRLAVHRIPGVSLYRYKISMTLEKA
jgi:hypothetical protein